MKNVLHAGAQRWRRCARRSPSSSCHSLSPQPAAASPPTRARRTARRTARRRPGPRPAQAPKTALASGPASRVSTPAASAVRPLCVQPPRRRAAHLPSTVAGASLGCSRWIRQQRRAHLHAPDSSVLTAGGNGDCALQRALNALLTLLHWAVAALAVPTAALLYLQRRSGAAMQDGTPEVGGSAVEVRGSTKAGNEEAETAGGPEAEPKPSAEAAAEPGMTEEREAEADADVVAELPLAAPAEVQQPRSCGAPARVRSAVAAIEAEAAVDVERRPPPPPLPPRAAPVQSDSPRSLIRRLTRPAQPAAALSLKVRLCSSSSLCHTHKHTFSSSSFWIAFDCAIDAARRQLPRSTCSTWGKHRSTAARPGCQPVQGCRILAMLLSHQ